MDNIPNSPTNSNPAPFPFSGPSGASPVTPIPPVPPTQTPPSMQAPAANPNGGYYANSNMPGGIPQPAPAKSTVFTPGGSAKKSMGGKNIIMVVGLVVVLGALVFGFTKARSLLTGAEGDCTPEGLKEASLTATSAEITFTTSKSCLTQIDYGVSAQSMLLQVPESMASLNHRIRLSPLLPSTTYYYQVSVGGSKLGTIRSFLTLSNQPTPIPTGSEPSPLPTQPVATGSGAFTAKDFEDQYGTANPTFDIDKNGVVNSRDWLLYQKAH